MLAANANVEIEYIREPDVFPVNYKLSWNNDADGNPENAFLQEIDDYGGECTVEFQNDEYIFDIDLGYLRIRPKKKTYTFYEDDRRSYKDHKEDYEITSIKIDGVNVLADFEYEEYVIVSE